MHAHDHPGGPQGGHDHAHAPPAGYGRAFAIGIALNLGFVVIEAIYGILAGSMALLSDAGHNLSDVLGLGLAWGGHAPGRRRTSERFTYGLRSSPSWRPCSTPCCCSWRSAASPGRRCGGFSSRSPWRP